MKTIFVFKKQESQKDRKNGRLSVKCLFLNFVLKDFFGNVSGHKVSFLIQKFWSDISKKNPQSSH